MEGDYHVGQILDALKELGVDDNTLLVFASDNGPSGEAARELGNQGTPDMGNSGPFRGELGEVTEGSIRTFCFVRWPGKVKPGTTSYAMFSIMDFLPTFARIIGGKMPTDRPIDGVDQTDVLFGKSETGNRDSLLTFIGARPGGGAVEAMAHVLHRRASDRHRAAARAGHVLGQRAHGRVSEDLQHRDGPARGSRGRRAVRVDGRTRARGGQEIQGDAQEVSEPARGQPHEVLRRRMPSLVSSNRTEAMDHMVVVMFENRSFDNLLGRLYQPGEVKSFEGVIGKQLSNPVPAWAEHGANTLVPYGVARTMNTPWPDPGEEFPHINTQLFGILDEANRGVLQPETFTAPDYPNQQPTIVRIALVFTRISSPFVFAVVVVTRQSRAGTGTRARSGSEASRGRASRPSPDRSG